MNEKIKKIIETYESVIYGNDEEIGFFRCYDTDYKGAWDKRLEIIKDLKEELEL